MTAKISKPVSKISRENLEEKKKRTLSIINILKKLYPDAHCALNHKNPFELLIATILSAQCTDERVNKVTPILFSVYPSPQKMSEAKLEDIERIIHSTGFYKNKAKNIKLCCQQLMEKHSGILPQNIEELHALAGVGRKTANVVLGNAFDIPSMVVDTHVMRLANRMGLVKGTDAVELEFDLQKIVPQAEWTMFSHFFIYHGRQVCFARSPKCESCKLKNLCPQKEYSKA